MKNLDRMKKFEKIENFPTSQLFSGITREDLTAVLSCLAAKTVNFPKDAYLLHAGDRTESFGLVLSGSVLVVQEDIWGNRNILSRVLPGQTFATAAAVAAAFGSGALLNAGAVADTPVTVMLLDVKRTLTVCSSTCEHHSRILRNLLGELAEKNLFFNEKIMHVGQRSTRAKLMSYLSSEAQRRGSYEFDIPFSRQQLADYLSVERSGLSLELGKMKKEGLLDFYKNHFLLKA